MATISIKVTGVQELVKDYNAFIVNMRDMTEPLTISSEKYLNAVHTNFTDNGATFGDGWPKLKDSTIRIKRELRKQGKSIGVTKPLLRTGLLRKSFGYFLQNKTMAALFNAQSYAKIHQESGTSTYKGHATVIPKRILADVDSARVTMVTAVFTDWLAKLVKSHKL